jgi:hypothetical protein
MLVGLSSRLFSVQDWLSTDRRDFRLNFLIVYRSVSLVILRNCEAFFLRLHVPGEPRRCEASSNVSLREFSAQTSLVQTLITFI